MNTTQFPPTSQNASPSIGGDSRTTVPVYQLNPPITNNFLTPRGYGFGPPQSHIHPVQAGDRPMMGGLGEYVSLPLLYPHIRK